MSPPRGWGLRDHYLKKKKKKMNLGCSENYCHELCSKLSLPCIFSLIRKQIQQLVMMLRLHGNSDWKKTIHWKHREDSLSVNSQRCISATVSVPSWRTPNQSLQTVILIAVYLTLSPGWRQCSCATARVFFREQINTIITLWSAGKCVIIKSKVKKGQN